MNNMVCVCFIVQAFASTPSLKAYMGDVGKSNPSLLKFNKNLKHCMEGEQINSYILIYFRSLLMTRQILL